MSDESDLKAIRHTLSLFWMLAKWLIIIAAAVGIFLLVAHEIHKQQKDSDRLEYGSGAGR